jgi:hypothetical protein
MIAPNMTKTRLSGRWQIYDGPKNRQPTEAINRPVIMICLLDIQYFILIDSVDAVSIAANGYIKKKPPLSASFNP